MQEIIPLLCGRTERQHFRYDRMQGIVVAAMLQSRQCWLPVLQQPTPYEQVVVKNEYTDKRIAHCAVEEDKVFISTLPVAGAVQLLIGPEGDFTPAMRLHWHCSRVIAGKFGQYQAADRDCGCSGIRFAYVFA